MPLTWLSALALMPNLLTMPDMPATPRVLPALDAPDPKSWINTSPLTPEAIRGRPVLIEFWRLGCGSCRNSVPWMKHVTATHGPRGLVTIAVHTPELPQERGRASVVAAVRRLDVRYPILLDDDRRFWTAMDNRLWPAFYLYDAAGTLVAMRLGELRRGEASAEAFEAAIERVLQSEGAIAPAS